MFVFRNLFFSLFILFSLSGYSQVRIGEWREHLPYQKASKLELAVNNLFCLTESGLFSYSLIDNELVGYGKVKGLSESEISAIAWSETEQILLIAYANGNLDFLADGRITNLPDIKNFSSLADKKINSIAIKNGLAYLATNFGIVVVHIGRKEVSDTYFIGQAGSAIVVNELAFNGDEIWAASNEGIYLASLSSINLADYNSWTPQYAMPDYRKECTHLKFVMGSLFVSRNLSANYSELYQYNNGVWTRFGNDFSKIYSLKNTNDALWLVQAEKIRTFNLNGSESAAIGSGDLTQMRDALDFNGRIFVADWAQSLVEIVGSRQCILKPDGPLSNKITAVYSQDKRTWAVAGGHNEFYEGFDQKASLFQLQNQEWTNYTEENTEAFLGSADLLNICGNQRDPSLLYVASWGDGLFVFKNQEYYRKWDTGNSPLGTAGISGIDSDRQGNLWLVDASSSHPVKVLSLEQDWVALNYLELVNKNTARKIICLDNGDKWLVNKLGDPLFAFNENGTLANLDDDVKASFFVRDEDGNIISSKVYDAIEDEEGNVWLGTADGVAIYSNPRSLLQTTSFIAYQPIISIDGSSQYLLGSERVISIAVDGANQKWLGTESSGAFLISKNADKQLTHFTKENSPLPSNKIGKISVNPSSGEVFFLTDKGMVSYKGSVTKGADSYHDMYVYPNPVRENYYGNIVVSGLLTDTNVKITDVSGNLVMEGKSAGGQYIWDGKNFNASRVHTGVYLVFCSNSDGSKSKVIKLLFIN